MASPSSGVVSGERGHRLGPWSRRRWHGHAAGGVWTEGREYEEKRAPFVLSPLFMIGRRCTKTKEDVVEVR